MKLRIGTRGSDLALWQANYVRQRLEDAQHEVDIVVLETRGDRIDDVPLQNVEGKAFFTKEIEDALLEQRVDIAVHSHKDLPVESPPGLVIAAVPPRADSGERLLVSRDAHDPSGAILPLRHGARIGTSAPRRQAQIAALRPDLELLFLRGNVPTRVQRLREGRYDGIVLACAGLNRLELDVEDLVVVDLPPGLLVPAPGQGALAIQVREDDEATHDLVRAVLHDAETERLVHAERRLLGLAGGGCNLALGASIESAPTGDGSWRARVFRGPDATNTKRPARWAVVEAPDPAEAAERALADIEAGTCNDGPLSGTRVAITGSESGRGLGGTTLSDRLAALGADVISEKVITIEDLPGVELGPALAALHAGDAVCVTSRRAARRFAGHTVPSGVLVAAVGPGTASVLAENGVRADIIGRAGSRSLARDLPIMAGSSVLHPCAVDALRDLQAELEGIAVEVRRLELYRTIEEDSVSLDASADARIYMSPSSVRASAGWEHENNAHQNGSGATMRIALGESTAKELENQGLSAFVPHEGHREDIIRELYSARLKRQGEG